MTIATYNWTWQQGEDLLMDFVYKEGPVGAEVPVDLTGYALRMDIVSNKTLIFTFNSDDEDTETSDEVTLGADGNISIVVDRDLTLPGGAVFDLLAAATPVSVFPYDVFLRNPAGRQQKILKGTITVETSYTLWQ